MKPITIKGVNYENYDEAAKALGIPANTVRGWPKASAKSGKSIDDYYDNFQPAHTISITVDDVDYESILEAAKKFGVNQASLRLTVAKHGTSGPALDKAVARLLNRDRKYEYDGKHFRSIPQLVKHVDNPFVAGRTVSDALLRGEHLSSYIKGRISLQRRLMVAGVQYKSVYDFYCKHAEQLPVGYHTITDMFSSSNSLQAIAEHFQLVEKMEKREFMADRPTRGHNGKPVRMSGWVWSSKEAFIAYYFGKYHGMQKELNKHEEGNALPMLPHLCDLWQWRKLERNNRLTPELEAQKPEWCHPINKDARESWVSVTDRQATPDWAVLPKGAKHSYDEMREDSEQIKTAKRMLAEIEQRNSCV